MAKKAFEISFRIAGNVASSFSSAFATATAKAEHLKQETTRLNKESRDLKRSLHDLDVQQRKGKISAEEYAKAYQKLSTELDKVTQKQQKLAQAEARQQAIQSGLAQARGAAGVAATTAAVPLAVAAGAAGMATFGAVQKAMDFEAQLSSIKAVTGATNEEMASMRALALQMGASTKYNALQAAQGIEELLKAGISPATVQAGGLQSALNLATAGGLELSEAAEIMSDALNGFKKDGMTAADAANILAGAANASSTGVQEMRYGISAVGPVADGIGVSFKGVNATLAAFANNALKGSDAGTSLKTFLANVQPHTKENIELFEKFGLTLKDGKNIFFDANGQLKDMSEVAQILKDKFKDLSDQQRSDIFYQLFGSDAVRAANILYKEGAEGINKMYTEMSKVTALDVAKEKMNNAAGAVEQMQGAFETLQIIAAEGTLPVIKSVALKAAELFEKMGPDAEKAGKAVGKALDDIFRPFTSDDAKFKDMDFSDKIITSLDIATGKIEDWVDGPGGEQMQKIFVKLAEIAANAWWDTLTGLVTTSAGQFAQGNIGSGAGLAALAYMAGGGLLLRGALTGGKGIVGAGKKAWDWRKSKTQTATERASNIPDPKTPEANTPKTPESKPTAESNPKAPATGPIVQNTPKAPETKPTAQNDPKTPEATKAVTQAAETAEKTTGVLGKVSKGLSKVALPLAAAFSIYDIATSNDKVKTGAETVGGLAGGWGGAALGATIGTALLPGIGTAVGGVLGGLAGSLAGSWGAGKTVDAVRGDASPTGEPSATEAVPDAGIPSAAQMAAQNLQLLAMYAGQASGWIANLYPIAGQSALVAQNLSLLTMYAGQASGWLANLYPVAGHAAMVSNNLSLLTMYAGQASGWIANLYPIAGAAAVVSSNLSLLAMYAGQASGWVASLAPVAGHAAMVSNNLSLLAMYAGQASGWIAGLYPIVGQGAMVNNNLSLLAMYVAQASGWIVSLAPIAAHAATVSSNLSLLAMYAGQASGWVASISSIPAAASSVTTALQDLATRIQSTKAPSMPSLSADVGPVRKYARGGIIARAHVGMVGEAGPEAIIPLSNGYRSRALSLWTQAGQALGVNSLYSQAGQGLGGNSLSSKAEQELGGNSLYSKAKEINSSSGSGQYQFVYAPVIHGVNKEEIAPVLQREKQSFEQKMSDWTRQKERVTFA